MKRRLEVSIERFPIAGRFSIARGSKTEAVVVTVTIHDGKVHGRGECVPYTRYGETVEGVCATIENIREQLVAGLDRTQLQRTLPAGAARNAVDSALWDFEAKLSGKSVSSQIGIMQLLPVTTAYTISLDSPEKMAEMAAKDSQRPILKIKLGAPDGDLDRIWAVRNAAPLATLIADANEGWTESNIASHLAACAEAKYALIEQPLPSKTDELLRTLKRPVRLCADESVHDRKSLARLKGLYDCVNIKLDKTGGLTEALELAKAAEALDFEIMIGCMVGSSLAMAPALMLAQRAQFVDLDGPLLLARDRENGLRYENSRLYPPLPELWG